MAEALVSSLAALSRTLADELQALARVIDSLRSEQAELIHFPSDRLEELLREKADRLAQVERARRDRLAAMDAARIPRDPVGAERRLAAHREVHAEWRRLRESLREASVLNGLNARIAAQRLNHVNARLETLRNAAADRVYDASGRAGERSHRRVIAAA